MRVAEVTAVYPPYRAGISHVVHDYAQYLLKSGEEVRVFTPAYPGLNFSEEVEALPGLIYGKAAVLPQLFGKLKDFDVVHLHYPFYGTALIAALAAKFFKKRLILTYHMKTRGQGFLGFIFEAHRLLVEPIILALSDAVLVSSIDYANSIDLRHKNLMDQPFGVDTDLFSPNDHELARKKINLTPLDFVFIFVGALDDAHYFKGIDLLLEAAAKLPKGESWKIIVVGGGNRLPILQSLAKEFGIFDHFIFAGIVDPVDLPDYYRAADVHLFPSIDRSEAFGLVTLEAASSGLPSLVSALPGVRTLVLHKETGLHVPPGNVEGWSLALQWALTHREKCRELGKNARVRVLQEYSQEVCLARLQRVFKGGKLDWV